MDGVSLWTQEIYDRLVEAFKAHPGAPGEAARKAGVSRHMARDGWRRGSKKLKMPPISALPDFAEFVARQQKIAERKDHLRGTLAEARQKAEAARLRAEQAAALAQTAASKAERERLDTQAAIRADQRDDSVGVLDEERRLRKGARAVAGQNIVGSAKWGRAHNRVAEELLKRVDTQAGTMTPDELLEIARTMTLVDRQRLALLREAIEVERLHRGDPSVILGVTPVEMSVDEAVKEIEEAQEILTRYKRRGLELIEGGIEAPTISVSPA